MEKKQILERIEKCNITYHIPGETDRSAMPVGNGELAASVWVNQKSEICFYLSRTDALTEIDRTVKLGQFTVRLTPGQFAEKTFSQRLILSDGTIRVQGTGGWVDIWIDCDTDLFCMKGYFQKDVQAEMEYNNWRTKKNMPKAEFWGYSKVYESADIVKEQENHILFYHKNDTSIVRESARLQEVEDCIEIIPDLLEGRIFGGAAILEQSEEGFSMQIATKSGQIEEKQFIDGLNEMFLASGDLEQSLERTRVHWNHYWCKSYIFVAEDKKRENQYLKSLEVYCKEPMEYTCETQSSVTRAYVLTKYMNACCNEGAFPVLYNGLLFNLCAGGEKHFSKNNFGIAFTEQPRDITLENNPDERSWCNEQLWQNIRHPYYSLLERGEGKKLNVLFGYYRRFWELNRIRARRYYGASGQHNTEMTLSCGLQSQTIYGIDRRNRKPGYAENRWGGAVDISPGLELSNLMLDYYDFYKDEEFLQENLIYIKELLQYIETRFPGLLNGVMQIGPVNCIETYRETINPTPIIAGLRHVIGRILHLGADHVSEIEYYREYEKKLPEIPREDKENPVLLPAERFTENRYNVEIPELYAIYPFREFTCYKENAQAAIETYFLRTNQYMLRKCFQIGETPDAPSYSGWQNLGTVAAVLGMQEEAAEILENNCSLQNPGTRFPAMWGPIYDAVPDTDHGANILNQLQKMVMQVERNKIYLAPALPKEWCVSFKLYADAETCVEGTYTHGKLEHVSILPEERKKDLILKKINTNE